MGLNRLFEIAGEKKSLLIFSSFLSAISALFMLVPYGSVYFILAELLKNATNIQLADAELMTKWGIIAFGGLVIGFMFLYASLMASHIAAFKILYGLRVRLARHIGNLHLGYLSSSSTGAVKKTLEQNVEKIEAFVAHQIPDLVNVLATVLVMFSIMFYINSYMTLVCLAAFFVGIALQMSMMFGDGAKEMVAQYHDALERINSSAIQYVTGMPAVKLFGQTVKSFRRFHDDMICYRDFVTSWTDLFQNGFIAFKTILTSLITFVLPVGVLLLSKDPHNMALALSVLFFMIMTPGAATPLYKLLYMSSMVKDISEGVRRIDSIFSEEPVVEPKNPKIPDNYSVEFAQVIFSYDANEASKRVNALENLSFCAKQGEVTALVGPSGSGKSTVANLIPRFWDVTEGAIRIGGIDIREISSNNLMQIVSFVFQDSFLFYDSIYENIRIGKPEATREEIINAAKAAQCHEFIEMLPDKYDTKIGAEGVYLSGGEEQRISVARAILKDAPILVLDEATAFADPENEHKMHLAIGELVKNKTVIVIAHRLSTIRQSDEIIVLDNGRLVESGKHEDLLEKDGLYNHMWKAYNSTSAWQLKQEEVLA